MAQQALKGYKDLLALPAQMALMALMVLQVQQDRKVYKDQQVLTD